MIRLDSFEGRDMSGEKRERKRKRRRREIIVTNGEGGGGREGGDSRTAITLIGISGLALALSYEYARK